MLREDAAWLIAARTRRMAALRIVCPSSSGSTGGARERSGRCSSPICSRLTRRLPSEMEDALWELVAAGLVTADGFENLRALIDPKRRRGEGRGEGSSTPLGRPVGACASRAPKGRATSRIEKWAEQLLDPMGRAASGSVSLARPALPRGGISCRSCGGWRREGRFAEAGSLPDLRESSLPGPKRSICFARSGVRGMFHWSTFPWPIL